MHWQTRSNTDCLESLPGCNFLFVIVPFQFPRVLVIILKTGVESTPYLDADDYPRQRDGLSEVRVKQIHGVEIFYIYHLAGHHSPNSQLI